jgi:hypothetical protein
MRARRRVCLPPDASRWTEHTFIKLRTCGRTNWSASLDGLITLFKVTKALFCKQAGGCRYFC